MCGRYAFFPAPWWRWCVADCKEQHFAAAGKMSAQQMGAVFADMVVVSGGYLVGARIGGIIGQALGCRLSVTGFLPGSLVGASFCVVYDIGKKKLISFCADTGFACFGFVEKNYELPEDVLHEMGVETIEMPRTRVEIAEIPRIAIGASEIKSGLRDNRHHRFAPRRYRREQGRVCVFITGRLQLIQRTLMIIVLMLMIVAVTGCGSKIDYGLPDNPIEFNTSTFANPSNEADEYSAIDYEGRKYIPFGTLKGSLGSADAGECLGYLVQEGQKLEEVRLFTLADDREVNYLVEIDTEGEMSQPSFYRAVDTVGKEIDVPPFIDSLDYAYWR